MQFDIHFVLACVLGSFVLGYLLTEWHYEATLRKVQHRNAWLEKRLDEVLADHPCCDPNASVLP
jgi:hypothetical protein